MPSKDPSGQRPAPPERPAAQRNRTPAPDMQPEDAGTPASGQDPEQPGTSEKPALKQTGKTDSETGSR
jgi:hypothetical protein